MEIIKGDLNFLLDTLEKQQAAVEEDQVEAQVKAILKEVQINGDEAVRRYTETFDKIKLTNFKLSEAEIETAYQNTAPNLLRALEAAKENIESFHLKQKQTGFIDAEKTGVIRGQLVLPIETVGIYVPGGTARYPSSVLMNAIPAKIAGVKRIIMVTPADPAGLPDSLLAAAKIAGVSEAMYQFYEYGRHEPTIGVLLSLADFYQVSLDYLVGRSDDPEMK